MERHWARVLAQCSRLRADVATPPGSVRPSFGVQDSEEGEMNLWATLGISPVVGLGAALTGLLLAGLFALRRAHAQAPQRGLRLDEPD